MSEYKVQAYYGNGFMVEHTCEDVKQLKITMKNLDQNIIVDQGNFETQQALQSVKVLEDGVQIKYSHLLE